MEINFNVKFILLVLFLVGVLKLFVHVSSSQSKFDF